MGWFYFSHHTLMSQTAGRKVQTVVEKIMLVMGLEGIVEGCFLSRPSVPCRIHEEERPESGVHRGEVKNQCGCPAVWLLHSG